ncbi:MAG: GNAT family N-acetyltransferase [Actinomycetota bacterium]
MTADVTIRPARTSDLEAIAAFTRDTFDWGDYVADVFLDWLDRDDMFVAVAAGPDDVPIAMGSVRMLSATEAWFHAARVHQDHRGHRIAGMIADEGSAWARDNGARIGRLLVEDWNEASIHHVEREGLRRVASVVRCTKPVGDASPSPNGNGGRRLPSKLRSRPAGSAEAQPAFASWSVGELGRAARGLFGIRWSFRRLTIEDLENAARGSAFWEIGAGWALAGPGWQPEEFEVGWLETRAEDASDLLRSLIDLAIGSGAESMAVWLPDVDWLTKTAKRLGFETELMHVYAREL